MSIEYSHGRRKRDQKRRAQAKRAYPQASPVKITRADGTVEIIPPKKGGDRSRKR